MKFSRSHFPICFVNSKDTIRFVAASVGKEARKQVFSEVVRAWVDNIPETELGKHYTQALSQLQADDLAVLAAWHQSTEETHQRFIPTKDFLAQSFHSLGNRRRDALKVAADFCSDEAFDAGVADDQATERLLEHLCEKTAREVATTCLDLYIWDRVGSDN